MRPGLKILFFLPLSQQLLPFIYTNMFPSVIRQSASMARTRVGGVTPMASTAFSRRAAFSVSSTASVPTLRSSRRTRARGITSSPIVEADGQEPSHAAIDETIVHEYPEPHEYVEGDLGECAMAREHYMLAEY